MIANGSAYLICKGYGLGIYKDVALDKFSEDSDVINRLTDTIQSVAKHILNGME